MFINNRKEQFNVAYVCALAAQAGFNTGNMKVDDESVDIEVGGQFPGASRRNPRVALQLKCTSQDLISGEVIKFPLSRKNYDDLRGDDVIMPRYLAVLLVPGDPAAWVEHHAGHMSLHNECYWVSIRNEPDTANATSVTVDVPLSQRLTTEALVHLVTMASLGRSA
jgi:hypothetical protein